MGSDRSVGRVSPSAPQDRTCRGESFSHFRTGEDPWPLQRTARSDGPYPSPVGRGSRRAVDVAIGTLPAFSLALEGSHGGAATPPYRILVGWTCWSASTSRKQAPRCLRSGHPLQSGATAPHAKALARHSSVARAIMATLLLAIASVGAAQEQPTPKIYRERIEPHWLTNSSQFWYRNDNPGDTR